MTGPADLEVAAHALGERLVGLDRRVDQRARQLLGPLERSVGAQPSSHDRSPARPRPARRTSACQAVTGRRQTSESRRSCSSSGVAGFGRDLFEHLGRGRRVERRELAGSDRQTLGQSVRTERREAPWHRDRPGPTLLQRRAVEEGVGPAGEDPVRRAATARPTRRSAPRPARLELSSSATRPSASSASVRQSSTVWRTSTWSGTATGPGAALSWQAARAGHAAASRSSASIRWRWIGRRWPPRDRGTTRARLRFHRHRAASIGCGSTAWVSVLGRGALGSIFGTSAQREAVLGAEREDDRVVVGRRLQLEVEGHAEPLAQGEPESAVDPPAVGGVDDELGALGLVEDPLDDDAGRWVGRAPSAAEPGAEVGDDLVGHLLGDAGRARGHRPARPSPSPAASSGSSAARSAPTSVESSAVRAGASPSQNGMVGAGRRRRSTRTVPISTFFTRHEWVPRRKMSPDGRLDREVLVHRADRHPVGVEDDPVVAGLGDGAAAGQGGQPAPRAGPQPSVDRRRGAGGRPAGRGRS